jgi:hypothetical protein
MIDPLDLPVVDPAELARFVDGLPLALDRPRLSEFLGGFPRRYFAQTPRVDIVKHFALMEGLRTRSAISALSRSGELWRLEIMCRDRRFLFSRITGALSCHGLNIRSAEAFANRGGLVLDTFRFADPGAALERDTSRRDLQVFLERAVQGLLELDALLLGLAPAPGAARLELAFDDEAHPSATRLSLAGPDFLGLLYRVSRAISEAGCDIEMAHVRTPGDRAQDDFYLTHAGAKLDAARRAELEQRLVRLFEARPAAAPGREAEPPARGPAGRDSALRLSEAEVSSAAARRAPRPAARREPPLPATPRGGSCPGSRSRACRPRIRRRRAPPGRRGRAAGPRP